MPTIYKPKRKPPKKSGDDYKLRQGIYQTERWKRLRLAKLSESPLCERCMRDGKITPAVDVHHLTSFTTAADEIERKRLAYDYNNLMSLCKECHHYVHHVRDDVRGGMG